MYHWSSSLCKGTNQRKGQHMKKLGFALAVAALATVAAWAQPALQTGQNAPAFKLADQFDKGWDITALKGNVIVVLAADRDSGKAMDPWMSNFKDGYGSKIKLLGLLDLHGVPGLFRGMAKSRIRKETKDPLMLDFSGATARAYMVNSKTAVVVVIDRTGVVRYLTSGAFSDESLKAARAAIDRALG